MLRRRHLLSSTAAAWATGAYALWPGLSTALATAPRQRRQALPTSWWW